MSKKSENLETKVLGAWCCELEDDKKEIDEAICNASKILAQTLFDLLPECPERTIAVRRLQECRFWIRQALCCEDC